MSGTGLRLAQSCLAICLCLGLAVIPGPVRAQEAGLVQSVPAVLVIDQDRLFSESAFGRASLERERAASAALEAENNKIQTELVAEEQALTLRRKALPAAEFTPLATAFDQKVERIRGEQDAKARDLVKARDQDVKAFLDAAAPVLQEILSDRGAGVILDKSTVILSLATVDVTDEAVARIDKVLGTSLAPAP
jgi:Skp family chaperone for outer membrane proteins